MGGSSRSVAWVAGMLGAVRRACNIKKMAAPFALALCAVGTAAAAPGGEAPASGAALTYALPKIAPSVFNGDVRNLPRAAAPVGLHQWNELEEPEGEKPSVRAATQPPNIGRAPMPAPLQTFDGLSFSSSATGGQAGAGWPPDVNGDVGPNHYIEAVNDAWAIYNKTGTLLASFTENSLWSGAGTGTPCDANNQGDPVVLHDAQADRWILTNFAFAVSGGNPVAPFYQCIAVSQTSDPVSGGWYRYAVRVDAGGSGHPPSGTLGDYPKFGVWTDCLYMAANGFQMPAGNYIGAMFASFSRSDLYSGAALTSSIGYIANASDPFTMIPSNLLGTSAGSLPPAGTPNYFVSESQTAFAFEVRKFTAGANCGAGGTLGAATNVSQASYTTPNQNIVPQPGTTNKLDSLGDRMMQKVQYRKIGAAESLWVVHSTQASTSSTERPQWAQINVSGGTVATTPVQQQIYAPDTTLWRWMPSLAVDGAGNMALGYSTSNATSPNFPSIAYSGRLAGDPLNNLSQTETVLHAGVASQTNTCGGAPCHRWGDYTAMSLDPADDCTFWYINEYYGSAANGSAGNWQTRIGSFKFPTCGSAPVTHTVTPSVSGGNGTIAPSTPQTVNDGATTSFTLTPSAGYHIAGVGGTCGGSLAGSVYTTSAVTADCTVVASFAIDTFTVTPSAGAGGSIAPSTPQTVDSGTTISFTLTANSGFQIANVGGTCGGSLAGNVFTTNAITANCTVVANFSAQTFTVTPSASAGGSIAPSTPQTVNSGATTSFTLTPNSGFQIANVGGTCGGNLAGNVYTTNAISANCTVIANFSALTFTVTPNAGAGGSIAPSTPQTVNDGTAVAFTLTPAAGFAIGTVGGCGGSLAGNVYTTAPVHADCTVDAAFNPPSQIGAASGGGQSALVGTAFAQPLQVRVADSANTPVAGAVVSYTVDAAGNGAAASLSSATATTDASGLAAVSATANATAGSYSVVAAVGGVGATASFALTNVESSTLTIGIDDGRDYARYGMTLDYTISVHNAGPSAASDISVANAFPPQLDIAQAQWVCLGGDAGVSCTPSGSGALSDSGVVVPAQASVSWMLTAPVLADSPDGTVTNAVSLTSASDPDPTHHTASDLDWLVILRTGFELGDDGAQSVEIPWQMPQLTAVEQPLRGGDEIVLKVPAQAAGASIATLLGGHAAGADFRVQRLFFRDHVWVRLLAGTSTEHASAWVASRPGAELHLALAAGGESWLLRLDGAARPIEMASGLAAGGSPSYALKAAADAVR